MDRDDVIAARAENNFREFMARGPRISLAYKTWVIGRDRKRGRVLVGGLGGLGIGEMWEPDDGLQRHDPTYETAPEMDSTSDFP
jgi:hypothetical protein